MPFSEAVVQGAQQVQFDCPYDVKLSSSYRFKKETYKGVSGIYLLRHWETGAAYVGATSNLANRAHSHAEHVLAGKGDPAYLRRFNELFPDQVATGYRFGHGPRWSMYLLEATADLRERERVWYWTILPRLNSHIPSYRPSECERRFLL